MLSQFKKKHNGENDVHVLGPSNFQLERGVNVLDMPYDYMSIMHYPKDAFPKLFGQTTIVTINPE